MLIYTFTNSINHSFHEDTFQEEIKQSEVITLYKRPDLFKKRTITHHPPTTTL